MIRTIISYFLGTLAISGVSISNFIGDEEKAWTALIIFLLTMFAIAFSAYRFFHTESKKAYPDGYSPISAFVRYTTTDGKIIVFETFRHIQIKSPTLRSYKHNFQWSGSKAPVVSSDLQSASAVYDVSGSAEKWFELKFHGTKIYNDVEVVHSKMQLDDSDGRSAQHIGQTVRSAIRLICFRVELLNADSQYLGKTASVTKRNLSVQAALDETLAVVHFDMMTKSYSWQITDPEPGYTYKLAWDKP